MTRAERRRADREAKKKTATYNMSVGQMEALKHKFIEEAMDEMWKANAICWAKIDLWIMHTKHGWGRKRLNRHFRDILKEFECSRDREVSFEEIEAELKKLKLEFEV